jgi:hypothetical protein
VAVVALAISLPAHARPDTSGRLVGTAVEDRGSGYADGHPLAFRRAALLRHLFPPAWDARVPDQRYGGSELVWYHYAHRPGPAERNYVLQPSAEAAPPGARLLAAEDGVSLYVRREAVWQAHQVLRPPSPVGSPLLAIPREVLFHAGTTPGGPPVIDLLTVARRLGVDTEGLLRRVGAAREDPA